MFISQPIRFILFSLSLLILTACGGGGGDTPAPAGTIPFITTWKTDNLQAGSSTDMQITIPTFGVGYDYSVDWGDGGPTDDNVIGDITHDYASIGTYTVTISGSFPQIRFPLNADNPKLLSVEQWGNTQWRSMNNAFLRCANLVVNATDNPDLSQVTDMNGIFDGASAFNQPIDSWNVATVTDMRFMFRNASAFNQPLNSWNVAAVTNMGFMFRGAAAFNQPLTGWNVAAVINMGYMFENANAFNQPLTGWNVAAVTSMNRMFRGTSAFNQPLTSWNVAAVNDMSSMFNSASAFNQPLTGWNVAAVTNMAGMFAFATAFNQPLGGWDVTSVNNMNQMFFGTTLSTANYDNLLIGWGGQMVQNNVVFDGGNSTYNSAAAQSARSVLRNTYTWTITDGGLAPAP